MSNFEKVILKKCFWKSWNCILGQSKKTQTSVLSLSFVYLHLLLWRWFFKEFLESLAFLHLLLHESFIFFLFEWPLKLLRIDMKSSVNINWSEDIELNPGSKSNSCENLSVCHSNLNSISAHNISKVSLLNVYTSLHSFSIICLSETYLDSSILHHDPNLEVQEYDLIRPDHPSYVKRGGVCIY